MEMTKMVHTAIIAFILILLMFFFTNTGKNKDTEESSKRNTTLYFGILLETKDLVRSLISLMVLFDKYSTLYKKDDTKNIFS